MYSAMIYVIACADNVKEPGNTHPRLKRLIRAILWPATLTSWFQTQNIRLHRVLNILWTLLIGGWLLSLMADKF